MIASPLQAAVRFFDLERDGVILRTALIDPPVLDPVAVGERSAVLFLHGRGECGTDGTKHLAVGLPPAAFLEPEAYPFVIIAPQKPAPDTEWGEFEPLVLEALDAGIALGGVDPARVAISGLSQGGHGTISFATKYPDRFVAAAPVCGYVRPREYADGERPVRPASHDDPDSRAVAEKASGLPWNIHHGVLDEVIPARESQVLAEVLKSAGADVELTLHPDLRHESWVRAYRDGELAGWLRARLGAR